MVPLIPDVRLGFKISLLVTVLSPDCNNLIDPVGFKMFLSSRALCSVVVLFSFPHKEFICNKSSRGCGSSVGKAVLN